MDFEVGQVVFSKCGRDKGGAFIVVSVEDNYVYIVDGKRRKLEKPKRKKKKHVQKVNFVNKSIAQMLINEYNILDSDIIKALKEYNKQ